MLPDNLTKLKNNLKLEMKGTPKPGKSAYAILQELGYKGTRQEVLKALSKDIENLKEKH